MRVGLPKGLMYQSYSPFIVRFFLELGADLVLSDNTNKRILDEGVKYCVDDACIPVKVFHGHVAELRDKCDMIVVPRIMSVEEGEFICPKFCGLPEMIEHSIPNLPLITKKPLYINSRPKLKEWCMDSARMLTKSSSVIEKAFRAAVLEQKNSSYGLDDSGYGHKVALVGHPYNVYDPYINMNIIKKFNGLGIGVCTGETVDDQVVARLSCELYKKPFWTFARKNYGFARYAASSGKVDGLVYLSSFACGIDSVVIELIKSKLPDFPMLVVKLDEHSGEEGFNTRLEAYSDMIRRHG